jgi:hypothetical protein
MTVGVLLASGLACWNGRTEPRTGPAAVEILQDIHQLRHPAALVRSARPRWCISIRCWHDSSRSRLGQRRSGVEGRSEELLEDLLAMSRRAGFPGYQKK